MLHFFNILSIEVHESNFPHDYANDGDDPRGRNSEEDQPHAERSENAACSSYKSTQLIISHSLHLQLLTVDPALSGFPSLEGLDEDFGIRRALIYPEPAVSQLPNLVEHFLYLPFLFL